MVKLASVSISPQAVSTLCIARPEVKSLGFALCNIVVNFASNGKSTGATNSGTLGAAAECMILGKGNVEGMVERGWEGTGAGLAAWKDATGTGTAAGLA